MSPFWHPLATLFMQQPRCYASSAMIRMVLAGEGAADLIYGGDRMWPAVKNGQLVRVEPCAAGEVVAGDVVLVEHCRVPDLLRVVRVSGRKRFVLRGDAEPLHTVEEDDRALLGRAVLHTRGVSQARRLLSRLRLELLEAIRHAPDDRGDDDAAQSVRLKYDAQAPFYASLGEEMISEQMLSRIRRLLPPDASVLVVGSGSGVECFALHRSGYRVKGVDFSAAMTSVARRGATDRNMDIEFVEQDIRKHSEPALSLGGIFFTNESYSFLPHEADRTALLSRMAAWLAPEGVIFLSARLARSLYERVILSIQRFRQQGRAPAAWGDSHARCLTPDGGLRRSFVHYFTLPGLRREAEAAGLELRLLPEGHYLLKRKPQDESA